MFQDDYVIRHIRLFVQTIARIIGLIKDGDPVYAMEMIRVAFNDLLGMSLDDFLAYPDERVRDFLYFGELSTMGLNRVALATTLLLQSGRVYSGTNQQDRALACYEKSLRLLLDTILADEEDPVLPEFAASIEEILTEVPLTDLSAHTLGPLSFYFDRFGKVGLAHDCLQILLARQPDDPDTRDMARSFYVYLLETHDFSADRLDRATAEAALAALNE